MAQCLCFSIVNDTPNPLIYTYTDCVTGEFFDNVPIDGNTTVYTCSSNGVTSNGAIVSINANDTPCGGCECGCETFTGFIYKGAGGTISITYTNCNNFTGTITNIIVPQSADGGGNESTYLFSEHFPFSEQPALCAKVGTSITHTGGSIGLFVPQFGDCCVPSFTVYLVSDCCDEKPDGYMYLPVGLLPNQVVGSSTDNTCYKIVEGAEAVENLDWDGSVFPVGQCDECQTTNEYFCDPEPPTPTPTSTKTPTPTPTITPTPTLTPTPTSQSTTIYFQRCCNIGQYLGIYNYYGTIVSEYSYLSITIGANTFCVKTVSSVPYPVTLYDFNDIELNGYDSCEECKLEYPCPPPPTQQIMGYENECTVITIFPMSIECVSISPSTTESNDGRVSVSITGGTPPYKYTWEGDGIGNDNHAPAIDNVPIGDYTVTVVDYWGDFTATTTCKLTAYTDCNFSGTVSEFTPPTPTPTKTPTPTPTSIPSKCDCRYGTVGISQNDIDSYGTVYVSYLDCDGNCYCVTNGEIGDAKPYAEGVYINDICIRKTTTTNSFDVSLYIIVDGVPQILPKNADSYVTLGGCCISPTQTPTPTPTQTPLFSCVSGQLIIDNNSSGSEISDIYATPDTWVIATSVPVGPGGIDIGAQGGTNNPISLDIDSFNPSDNPSCLLMFVNSVLIESKNVTSTGTYTFSPYSIVASDCVWFIFNQGECV